MRQSFAFSVAWREEPGFLLRGKKRKKDAYAIWLFGTIFSKDEKKAFGVSTEALT